MYLAMSSGMYRKKSVVLFILVAVAWAGSACPRVGRGDRDGSPAVVTRTEETGWIELVESVPVETTLDQPRIRNTHEVWAEMVEGAETTIDIETFYFSGRPEGPGRLEPILAGLAAASKRGVKIRALSDARFDETYPDVSRRLGRLPGAEARVLDAGRLWGGVVHTKFWIVDGRELFLGSQNWDWRALEHTHELGLRIRHRGLASALGEIFAMDWRSAAARPHADSVEGRVDPSPSPSPELRSGPWPLATSEGDAVSATLAAGPPGALPDGIPWDEPLLVKAIDGAERTIRVHLLTFRPVDREGRVHETLEGALRRAAVRKVEVRLLLSDWSKDGRSLPYVKSLAAVPGVTIRFTTIPAWSGGFIPYARVEHAKYLVADSDLCWIGTGNWTPGSFHESRNVSLFVDGTGVAARVIEYFEGSWGSEYAEPVDLCEAYGPPKIAEE